MPYIEKIALEKARKINGTASIYGTFAEIGAGQEVVNHFFKAGQSSKTVAKSMSAYDMTFSDDIYGKTGRYVSKNRLFKMLDHEYKLLQKRLRKKRGHNTKFFAFADTVATSTASKFDNSYYHQGWMGIRFQSEYNAPYNEIILHVNLLDKTRLQQHEALGVLGVNLIYSAFYGIRNHKNIIKSLFDNFESSRVDIDFISCSGKVFKKLNHQLLNMELIHQKSTEVLLFQKKGEIILPADALYEKPILIQQYPFKNTSSDMKQVLSYIKKSKKIKNTLVSILNVPIQNLKNKKISYYLNKHLSSERERSKYVLISDFKKLYEFKDFIRKVTNQYIFIILSIDNLKQIFNVREEDVLMFFSRLCDHKTILMVPPYKQLIKSKHFHHLEKYLMDTKRIIPLK